MDGNPIIGLILIIAFFVGALWPYKGSNKEVAIEPQPEPVGKDTEPMNSEPTGPIRVVVDEGLLDAPQTQWDAMDVLPHLLLSGPPGTGKTQFAKIIANRLYPAYMFTPEVIVLTPIQLKGSGAKRRLDTLILEKIRPGTILFIDEIHGIDTDIAEALYSAMQDGEYHYNSTDGQAIYQMPPFTLIGATTDPGKVIDAMRDRFIQLFMEQYTREEIQAISALNGRVSQTSNWDDYVGQTRIKSVVQMHIDAIGKLQTEGITKYATKIISILSRHNPRYEKMLRLHATAHSKRSGKGTIDAGDVVFVKSLLGIDDFGFYPIETSIIKYIVYNQEKSRKVGRKAISQKVGLRQQDVDELIKPLRDMDLLTSDQRGMLEATEKAMSYYREDI